VGGRRYCAGKLVHCHRKLFVSVSP
jgi:hypothetical protein